MHLYRYGLLVWVVVVCCRPTTASGEDSGVAGANKELRFPRLIFEVSDDSRLRRQLSEERCSDIGHIWARMLKDASVREELELLDYQERRLSAAARSANGDSAKYRAAVKDTLLPHQLDGIRQLIGRYRCLAGGILQQVETGDAFSRPGLTARELQRISDNLAQITKNYYAISARELQVLDLDIRKTLTRAQLQTVSELIGDGRLLEGPFLDFAILRLETIAEGSGDRLDLGLRESAAVLGRSTQYQLAIAGDLRSTKGDTPMHFFAAFRNGINRAGLRLNADQRHLLAEFERNLISEVSSKSKRVYRLLTEEKLTLDGAQDVLNSVAKREINRTVSVFDTLLDREQQNRLDDYVLRRDLAQRGMLPVLVEGRRIAIPDDQKKALTKIIERRLDRFRELTRETETKIWSAVKYSLTPQHRNLWVEAYGDGTLKSLPVSPALLLFRPRSAP